MRRKRRKHGKVKRLKRYFTFNRKDDYEDHIRIEQEREDGSQKDRD